MIEPPTIITIALSSRLFSIPSPIFEMSPITHIACFGALCSLAVANPAIKGRSLKRRADIAQSQTISGYSASFGQLGVQTNVQKGVTYWLNGGSTHNFFGNIDNSGNIIVSQTSYLRQYPLTGGQTSDWVGHDDKNGNLLNRNGALIMLNDIGANSAPTYDWYIHSMTNNGTIQWCGRGDTGGSTYQMYSDLDGVNNGLISFEQTTRNLGASFVWRNPVLTTSKSNANIYNNGAFRLINTVFHNVQNIYGNGCWQLGKGGILYLEDGTGVFQNPSKASSFAGQSIVFQDPDSTLHMDTAVYSGNSNFGATVYGFSTGNAIEFYQTISSLSYDATAGNLNVKFVGSNQVNINIGKGYDASKFAQRKNPEHYNVAGYNAIFYDGAAPAQSVPTQCGITAPICSDLANGLPVPPSASTTLVASSPSTSTQATVVPSSAAPSLSSSSTSSRPVVSSTASSASSTSSVPLSSSTKASFATSSVPATSPTAPPATTCGTPINLSTPYQPYYPAIATGLVTVNGSLTASADKPCPTMPEAGTYCGFLNPLDPCAPQPDGYGPVSSSDTPAAFLANDKLHAFAQQAPKTIASTTCGSQYVQIWQDLDASASADAYIRLQKFQTYDAVKCAAACDQTAGCLSFNVYAERDPSLNPTDNDSSMPTVWGYNCPNPPSMTVFGCTLWGSNLTVADATNKGSMREQFQVVITASDGYARQAIA